MIEIVGALFPGFRGRFRFLKIQVSGGDCFLARQARQRAENRSLGLYSGRLFFRLILSG